MASERFEGDREGARDEPDGVTAERPAFCV